MNVLLLITYSLFFLWVIRNIFFWVSLWQLKEYRFDRLWIHLTETTQGRDLLFSPLSLLKWLLFFFYAFAVFNDTLISYFQFVVLGVYIIQAILVLRELYLNIIKKPVFTAKALFLIFATLAIVFFLFAIPLLDKFFWLLLIDRITPFVVSLIVFLLSFPTEIYRDIQIDNAKRKLESFKDILVIGVTGSYGKSSTKDYIAQILSTKFHVLKTKGTNNTPIGIAHTILNGLQENIEIFVVEMGAYKRGEIAEMCKIVHPKIGVLTAVNEQHLSLFKSLENTKKAKYELIDALPENGFGLFNGNNINVYNLYKKSNKRKVIYRSFPTLNEDLKGGTKPDIYAFTIVQKKTTINFDVKLNNKISHFSTSLLGIHNIENILPGIYLANYLGMKDTEIKKAVAGLMPMSKTMIYDELRNGTAAVDDTYNANPDAVIAALKYMGIYNRKKILVLQPMIELGKKANFEHFRVAKEIGKVCDYLLLTNRNYYRYIRKGLHESGGKCEVKIGNAQELADFIKQKTKKGDVVVFEGKEAAFVLEKLTAKTV